MKSCGPSASCTSFDWIKVKQQQIHNNRIDKLRTGHVENKTVDSAERSSKHRCAQCLACRREQLPVGRRSLPVATHASDTQPAVYFLCNRKWTSFCRQDWGWVVQPCRAKAKHNSYSSADRIYRYCNLIPTKEYFEDTHCMCALLICSNTCLPLVSESRGPLHVNTHLL